MTDMDLLTALALALLSPREAVEPYLKPLPLVLEERPYRVAPGTADMLLREDPPVLARIPWGAP
jgi:hypothetical protein